MDERGRFTRGARVSANTTDGAVERLVWEEVGDAVLVCSEPQFEALQRGLDAPMPIGFPKWQLVLVSDR
jgi:hypothetical protein